MSLITKLSKMRFLGALVFLSLFLCCQASAYADTFGHSSGDEALRSFAGILTSSVRKTDIPCRIGGEEFAVILPDTALYHAKRNGRNRVVKCDPGSTGRSGMDADVRSAEWRDPCSIVS